MKEFLNVPKIQKELHTRHKEFIEKYGGAVEKLMADHKLFSDIVMAKLNRILIVFKEEMIIDDMQITEQGPYKRITLNKKGYDAYIVIETNGTEIVFQGYTYGGNDFTGDFAHMRHKIRDVNTEDFDWVDFSIQLIDYIHKIIYDRKEAMETRLSSMFQPSPFNTTAASKTKKIKNDNK